MMGSGVLPMMGSSAAAPAGQQHHHGFHNAMPPSLDPLATPQSSSVSRMGSGPNSSHASPAIGGTASAHDQLQSLSLGDSVSSLGSNSGRRGQIWDVGNGVLATDSGEWITTDAEGHRISSGGSRSKHAQHHHHQQHQSGQHAHASPSKGGAGATGNITDAESETEDEKETKMEILVGDVDGRVAILIDDMVDTGRTLALAAKTLKDAGASEVYAIIAHGLLSGKATELVKRLEMEKLVVTNTIDQRAKSEAVQSGKLEVMDVSAVIAESIRRTHNGESISLLFREDAAAEY